VSDADARSRPARGRALGRLAVKAPVFVPSGFFALRTPLLPWEALAECSAHLGAVRALADEGDLDGALKGDRERTLCPRPAVKDEQ